MIKAYKYISFSLVLISNLYGNNLIYYIPWDSSQNDDSVFEQKDHGLLRDILTKAGYEVHVPKSHDLATLKKAKYIIDYSPDSSVSFSKARYLPNKFIPILWEPPAVIANIYQPKLLAPMAKVLTWNDNLVDDKKYFKINYPVYHYNKLESVIPFSQKKFCCMINANKDSGHVKSLYPERRKIIKHFNNLRVSGFDLYGGGWSRSVCSTYKGTVVSKVDCMRNYKFCICFESMRDGSGYITEKIFDCFYAGCVPVYWGADNIENYIPSDCFIDYKKLGSPEKMHEFLKSIDGDKYNSYIEAIKRYLSSNAPLQFTPEARSRRMAECILG